MTSLLKYRAGFIVLLFSLSGGALPMLLHIDEMKTYYPAVSFLLALTVSLLVSFLIKARWNTKFRNLLKLIAVLLFFCFVASIFYHTLLFQTDTFRFTDFDSIPRYYVKGDIYTPAAENILKKHPMVRNDSILLYNYFGGIDGKDYVWTEASIRMNTLKLVFSYCTVVIFFVAIVSMLAEILALRYKASSKKLET